eukprot:Colp12_sorted_trinity150504_noHs@2489
MRSVTLVQHLRLPFQDNIFPTAITLGDVDNDKGNEIVIGNVNGDLSIFKGVQEKAWRTASGLGTITCVGVGNLRNDGKNCVVVVSAEGVCRIFDVDPSTNTTVLEPASIHHVAINVHILLIADVDNDGQLELLLGRTDRVLHAYRFSHATSDGDKPSLARLVHLKHWEFPLQVPASRDPNHFFFFQNLVRFRPPGRPSFAGERTRW